MNRTKLRIGTIAAGAAASLALGTNAHGQAADALIDKLVDKGILTMKEAAQLREETDQGFTKAYQVKSGLPDWVTSLRMNGDLRLRYDGLYSGDPGFSDRHRYRYRLRYGVTAVMLDNIEVGFRLTSADPASGGAFGGDPISGNSTFQDNGTRKFVYIDLAYAKWNFFTTPSFGSMMVLGKMENPFVFSDMIFDPDYTPEGAALQFNYNVNDKHQIKLAGGAFVLDEISNSSRDPYMYGAQLRLESKWTKRIATSAGVAGLNIVHAERLNASQAQTAGAPLAAGGFGTNTTTTWTVPDQNVGNLRTGPSSFTLVNNYNPVVADLSFTYSLDEFPCYSGAFPIKVGGEYAYNPAADDQGTAYSVGLTLGKSGKRRTWEIGAKWKELYGDAWYEELVDSDSGAFYRAPSLRTAGRSGYLPGTNIRGYVVKAGYSPYDSWTLNVTWYRFSAIDESPVGSQSRISRIQLDSIWKF